MRLELKQLERKNSIFIRLKIRKHRLSIALGECGSLGRRIEHFRQGEDYKCSDSEERPFILESVPLNCVRRRS